MYDRQAIVPSHKTQQKGNAMDMSKYYPSEHLSVGDLDGYSHKLKISRTGEVEYKDKKTGETNTKPVIYFEGKEKGFVCNKTNNGTLMGEFGKDGDGWIGKEIELYPGEYDSGHGVMKPHIKMRIPLKDAPPDEDVLF